MTDDSLADVQSYRPSTQAIAAFDYADGLHLFMLALVMGDVDAMQSAVDLIDDAARRMRVQAN